MVPQPSSSPWPIFCTFYTNGKHKGTFVQLLHKSHQSCTKVFGELHKSLRNKLNNSVFWSSILVKILFCIVWGSKIKPKSAHGLVFASPAAVWQNNCFSWRDLYQNYGISWKLAQKFWCLCLPLPYSVLKGINIEKMYQNVTSYILYRDVRIECKGWRLLILEMTEIKRTLTNEQN